jgi:hypothetical protein
MVSNIVDQFLWFLLSFFNNYLAILVKRLGDSIINVYRNYGDFCIESALTGVPSYSKINTPYSS